MIYHVVAVADGGVIGKDNKLPWHFSSDLKFFKKLTVGNTVIMGRRTFDSIGKALPDRDNIVVSRSVHAPVPGVTFVTGIPEALEAARKGDTYIIGGASIYKETLAAVDGIYLTRIHATFAGDAHYPGVPEGFREVSRTVLQEDPLIEVRRYDRTSIAEGLSP
ncbi:MAG: Dihydrofolate reductase [Candidatus Omnitrophica bacterium]|nr:Dihydrofolate reductase [Candidatus Omnitrophota bacterium]